MFLNSFHAGAPISSFDQIRDHGVHCTKMAISNELSYHPDLDASNISVDETGSMIVLEGTVSSVADCQLAIKTAESYSGAGNVISRLVIVGRSTRSNSDILVF